MKSKLESDTILRWWNKQQGQPVLTYRCGNSSTQDNDGLPLTNFELIDETTVRWWKGSMTCEIKNVELIDFREKEKTILLYGKENQEWSFDYSACS
jgi:hypothetical protein